MTSRVYFLSALVVVVCASLAWGAGSGESLRAHLFPSGHDGSPRHEHDDEYMALSGMSGHYHACEGRNNCFYGRSRVPFNSVQLFPTAFERFFGHKKWFYTSVVTDSHFLAFAVVDLGYVGNAFVYSVDFERGEFHEFTALTPFAKGVTVSDSSVDGCTEYKATLSSDSIKVCYSARDKSYQIDIDVWATRSYPAEAPKDGTLLETNGEYGHIHASTKVRQSQVHDSLAVLFPLGYNAAGDSIAHQPGYTHKAAGLKADVKINDGRQKIARPVTGLANIDYTNSLARRVTKWKWVSFAGKSRHGRRTVGINLSTDVYESPTGASQENGLWLDGHLFPLRHVDVIVPRDENGDLDEKAQWTIRSRKPITKDDVYFGEYHKMCPYEVDLTFTPFPSIPVRQERLHALVITSDFYQPFGEFDGYVCVPEGADKPTKLVFDSMNLPPDNAEDEHDGLVFFDNVKGVVEDHYAKW